MSVSSSYWNELNKKKRKELLDQKMQNYKAPVKTTVNSSSKITDKTDAPFKKTVDFKKKVDEHVVAPFRDIAQVSRNILGIDDDTASFLDLTWKSAQKGYYNSRLGEESFKAMDGLKNDKEVFEAILSGDEYQFTPGNEFASGVSAFFEQLGQQYRQYTNPRTIAFTAGAAGTAAIAGQLGPQVLIAEEIATVPAAALAAFKASSAASNFEIEAGHAYNEMLEAGISEETAKKVATAVGAGNAGLELLQVDELFDAYKATKSTGVAKNFIQKLIDELLERGIDVATETGQEVLQEGVTVSGVQAASLLDKGEKAFTKEEVAERLKDTALSSLMTFGLMNVPAAAKNTVSISKEVNSDQYKTEKKVVDKVYNDLVSKAEKNGKVSSREKKKIFDDVIRELETGGISTDFIESVIDEEGYNAFKAEKDKFFKTSLQEYNDKLRFEAAQLDDLQNRLAELKDAPKTKENMDLLSSLARQITEITEKGESVGLKANLDSEVKRINNMHNDLRTKVRDMVKGTKLEESYNELIRSQQKYQAHLENYSDPNAKKTIENILKSGIGDNSNKFRAYADWLAKISEDTGMVINLTNDEALKGTQFDKSSDGFITNGYKTSDGIVLNADSPKALNSIVGHEISHVFETTDTELYKSLQDKLFNYAISKEGLDGFNKRIKDAEKKYQNNKDTTPEAEVLSDLIGDYLFTDYDFVHNLSVENRDIFDKMFDQVKYLNKIVTAGSHEARELEKVKKTFEKAYREAGKAKADNANPTSGFTGSYTGTNYTAEQAKLLSSVSLEGIQNATDLASRRDVTFNDIGINDKDVQQAWIDAGLSTIETNADGDQFAVVNDAMLMDERERRQKNTANSGVKYSLLVTDKNGNSTPVNPYETSREQIKEYMIMARKGQLNQYTYFPVSPHTPSTVIATLRNAGIEISDKPLAMQAKKARQSQLDGQHIEADGTVIRHHALSTAEIQEVIDKLNDPIIVIHQTERIKTIVEDDKKIRVPAPDNFVFFVTLDNGKECVAVIEFDSTINKDMIRKDGQGDDYHTTVTVFEPDSERDGEFFDYSEYLVDITTNYELDVVKESPKSESAISQTQATDSEMELSNNRIAHKNSGVNLSFSQNGNNLPDFGNWNVRARDFGYQDDIAPVAAPTRKVDPVNANDYLHGKLPIGQLVKAADRNNFGYIYDYDDVTDLYSVRFTSKDGASVVKEFSIDELTPAYTGKEMFPNSPDIDQMDYENASAVAEATQLRLAELAEMDLSDPELAAEYDYVLNSWVEAKTKLLELDTKFNEQVDSITDADAPPEKVIEAPVKFDDDVQVEQKTVVKPKKNSILTTAATAWVDKGAAIEKLSLDTGNMELQAKWNSALPTNTDAMAQYFMEHGNDQVPALKAVMDAVNKSGKTELFDSYLKHLRNIDSMSLQDRMNLPNKAVFGDDVTAKISRKKVAELESKNPEFKELAQQIYDISNYLLDELVKENLLTKESADYLRSKYPHYIPLKRTGKESTYSDSAADNKKASISNTIKTATGGNGELDSSFNALAERIQQHYRAIARNRFGIELKNTLNSVATSQQNLLKADDMLDMFDGYEKGLLNAGRVNGKPTFTVFEDGKRIEFEITDELYDALKPTSKGLAYRNPFVTKVSEARRKLLTVWNPVFSLYRNPIKDFQDVAINSQHALKTYANIPNAIYQLATGGEFANEYHKNGGMSNTFYDSKKQQFTAEDNAFKKIFGLPFRAIEKASEFIEQVPRLAEYIASRKDGRSVERSMLDAARVTTNFAAGGDYTKWLNAHGATFLNASVQGAAQHVRNFRESAKLEGVKGVTKTLAKYVIAGVPAMIFNGLLWDDDEEYEELNDYIKDNYYVIAKLNNGQFIRIPKGRTAAVMSELMEQMGNLVTGNDEVDFDTFFDLFWDNIAPNNPLTDNMVAPLIQTLTNNAWYSADIVPARLQDLPAAEQYDESTDIISKWLGENLNISPMKVNYLLDQYLGGIGDVVIPMMTPEVESGDDSLLGNLLAPWKKELVVDTVLDNKNPGELFDLADQLEGAANSKTATEEDKLKSMYVDSIAYKMSDLYAEKREVQSSDLPAKEKFEKIRQLQEEINSLARNTLDDYENVVLEGNYAEVGSMRYNKDPETGTWYQIKAKNKDGSDNSYYVQEQLATRNQGLSYADYWNGKYSAPKTNYAEFNGKRYHYDSVNRRWYEIKSNNADGSLNSTFAKEQFVTNALGISYDDYWNNKQEYDFQYEYPEKFEFLKEVGVTAEQYLNFDQETKNAYSWASNNREAYTVSKAVSKDLVTYRRYTSNLYDIKADKDKYGNSISGSRKKKVIDYINDLDADYGEKIILYKTEYPSDDSYNRDILEYLNGRKDLTFAEKTTILKKLNFRVDSKGNVSW